MSGDGFEEKSVLNYRTEPEAEALGTAWKSRWANNLQENRTKSRRSGNGLACLAGWCTRSAGGFLSCSLFCTVALGLSSAAKSACVWFERRYLCNLEAITMTQHAERVSVLGKLGYTQARFWESNQEADDSH